MHLSLHPLGSPSCSSLSREEKHQRGQKKGGKGHVVDRRQDDVEIAFSHQTQDGILTPGVKRGQRRGKLAAHTGWGRRKDEKKEDQRKNKDLKETDGDRERQITKHLLRVKILKCPKCLKWCRVSKAVEQSAADKTELSKSSMDDSWLFSFPCVCVWRSIVPLLCLCVSVCVNVVLRSW